MSYNKTHDLVVKTGTYTKDGEEKGRYENVGMVLTGDEGELLLLLKRTFNPAGVPKPDGKDSVALSMFEVRDRNQDAPKSKPRKPAAKADPDLDQDIPF